MTIEPNEQKILDQAQEMGAEYCDLRTVTSSGTSLEVKDGELKKTIVGSEEGASIRVLYKGAWAFSATNELTPKRLESTLETAFKLAKLSSTKILEPIKLAEVEITQAREIWEPKLNPDDISIDEKYELIRDLDKVIHDYEGILTVTTGYTDGTIRTHFVSTEGADNLTGLTRTVAQANLVAKKGADIIGLRTRIGGTKGYELFKHEDLLEKGKRAAESALRILGAEHSPSGRLTVVTDPDLAGVFAHEALGHAAEADHIVTGESILIDKIGHKIASENVTIVDDPTIPGAFGSFPYDDEGVQAQRKVLIENGVLKNYIYNRETAHKLSAVPNGGARAESYGARPLVRMSNTLIEPGTYKFEEMLGEIKTGIYAKGTRGGEVDPTKGAFQFNAQEAFLIENGEITKPLRDVSLSGLILETMQEIDAVGDTRELGDPGFCGKGQFIPVGDGGPYIRIHEVIVGGGN
ncbi:MAG: TldD/PmbA family protein [Thermoplasmata archaeon]|nr:TldD/PmbA family protein [Thermoplasmata archaeon]